MSLIEELEEIAREVGKLAIGDLAQFKDALVADAKQIAEERKEDIVAWRRQLADGDIDQADFDSNMQGIRDVLEVRLNTYLGIAQIRLSELGKRVLGIVAKALIPVVL